MRARSGLPTALALDTDQVRKLIDRPPLLLLPFCNSHVCICEHRGCHAGGNGGGNGRSRRDGRAEAPPVWCAVSRTLPSRSATHKGAASAHLADAVWQSEGDTSLSAALNALAQGWGQWQHSLSRGQSQRRRARHLRRRKGQRKEAAGERLKKGRRSGRSKTRVLGARRLSVSAAVAAKLLLQTTSTGC